MKSHYQAETITVVNNFQPSDPLQWIKAVCMGSADSLTVFDARKRLVLYNNRFGTFDNAGDDDLLDLYTLFEYLSREYIEWIEALGLVKQVFKHCTPREFTLTHKTGWRCKCTVMPVMDNNRLGGVVLLASKQWTNIIERRLSQ